MFHGLLAQTFLGKILAFDSIKDGRGQHLGTVVGDDTQGQVEDRQLGEKGAFQRL